MSMLFYLSFKSSYDERRVVEMKRFDEAFHGLERPFTLYRGHDETVLTLLSEIEDT